MDEGHLHKATHGADPASSTGSPFWKGRAQTHSEQQTTHILSLLYTHCLMMCFPGMLETLAPLLPLYIALRNSLQSCFALQKIQSHIVHSIAVPMNLCTRLTVGGTKSLVVDESLLPTAARNQRGRTEATQRSTHGHSLNTSSNCLHSIYGST